MAKMTTQESQSATEYDDRTTVAVKSVLVEIGQILGSFKGKFAIIGGPSRGCCWPVRACRMLARSYAQREGLRRFQLVRQVPARDGGEAIDMVVDFLMPRDAEIVKNDPPLVADFAVQRADGADLAMRFYQMVAVAGPMPDGGTNRVEIAVCSIPALLA